ncbi:SseB family protein [Microbacterium sp. LRZ72]|uniref:SseB family protein n=1 Tax=Microbacterium sp. LRZ72 TaxID=2942481 RepID=UPI0029A39A21|nr:SseB family protein [Microbacterium sp. LRZ72]MDX2376009.1 SseB family protein [Microbacterium sp. LRZ72]
MALFSRRSKDTGDQTDGESAPAADETVDDGILEDAPAASEAESEDVPQVNISVSAYRGVGASSPGAAFGAQAAQAPPAQKMPPAEAPEPTETVPGLRDNTLLRQSLQQLSEKPTGAELLDVLRQFLQNQVFLRVRGNARALLSEGKELPLAVAKRGDDQYVLVYSSGATLQDAVRTDGESDTSAVGQPALAILRHVLAGPYAGILVDGASAPARAVLPRSVIEPAVEQADPQLRIKTLLAAPRTDDTPRDVATAMTEAPMWVAVRQSGETGEGEQPRMGIAEARMADGQRLLEVYSHPLEIVARGRGDRPLPFTAAQLGKALAEHPELNGVIIDGGGPWVVLDRDTLAPVLALADSA